MYDFAFFKDNEHLLTWSKNYVSVSHRAEDCVGYDGAINYVHMSRDLLMLYQLARHPDGSFEVEALHMLLWGAQDTLRKDICKISEFYHPKGEVLWHASVVFGGRPALDFCVTNAFQKEGYEKYSKGGNFEMTFAGLGTYMECMNDKGVIRFYDGNPVEMERVEKNDPTIDHADMVLSELRSLNSGGREDEPALAEFTGVVESCTTEKICGVKCYRIRLMSGAPAEPSSFPWSLLIAASRIEGKYVPRVGDSVHGNAYMFGTFHGEARDAPTVYLDRELQQKAEPQKGQEAQTLNNECADESGENVCTDASGKKDGWEYLPRCPEVYPEVKSYGGGLSKSVAKVLPKYVVYSDYRKKIKGELKPQKVPSRKELKRILDSIDYVITSQNNLRMFGSVIDSIGIRHFVVDAKTGERHLWCELPSGFGREHFHSNLLVALNENGEVLRYTFYMGEWDWHRLYRGMKLQINFQSKKRLRYYDSMKDVLGKVGKMVEHDYLVASSLGHTAMMQAYCYSNDDGVLRFRIEWQVHYLPWQFYVCEATREQLVSMFAEFDKHGIEPVETMARWKWCKLEGNV